MQSTEIVENRTGAGTPDLNKLKIPTNIETYSSKAAMKSQR